MNPSKERIENLLIQMKYRLQEGNGEAIYEIGGTSLGLNKNDMQSSLSKNKTKNISGFLPKRHYLIWHIVLKQM